MTYQPTPNDNQDYALPSHFFDSEATQIAQPVKPLTADAVSQRLPPKPARRSWMFGAIAVSALVGSLVTVAAFSFYQRRTANRTPNQQATAPAAVIAPTPDLAAFPSPEASPSNIAVSLDETGEAATSPSPENSASSRAALTEARRNENANNSNAANDSVKNAKDKADDDDDTPRRATTTAAAEKQPKKDENVAANKNAEREAEERRAAERATAERLAAERAAARREEAKRSANEDGDEEPRPRKVGKRGDDANDEDEEPVAPPQRRSADRLRRIFEGERQPRQRRNPQEGTSERVRGIFEGQPPR